VNTRIVEINYSEARRRGMKWGKARGYYGERGGWIYRGTDERPVCQGWAKLYFHYRARIDSWIEEKEWKDES
jgi:hypothetical protein